MKTMGGSDKCKTHAEWLEELRNEAVELRELVRLIVKSLGGKAQVAPANMTPHEVAILNQCRAALAAPATAEKSSAVGDAAAMYEALKYVLQFDATDEAAEEDGLTDAERIAEYADHIEECQKKARAALSAPPRNCDLARDWVRDLYAHFQPPASIRREMPPEWVDSVMAFCRWLVAPAAEKEGGADAT